ncbi:MAG: hypothetical protein O3C27_17355, partial [Actinomycetota bacterium]|nr:hypothetical protein [Actinomycetota bacterium]
MDVGIIIGEATPLSWECWKHVVHLIEGLGFHSLFRSDHYFNGKPKDAIDVCLSFDLDPCFRSPERRILLWEDVRSL